MTKQKYNPNEIEKKWQKVWEKEGIYFPDINKASDKFYDRGSQTLKKFYNLWMFPYPSAEGLHAGHAFASTGSDIYGRYMRMNGKTVFQPIGYDSFGIHSENYAIKINEDPYEVVKRTTKHYEEQMRSLGHGYDWTKTVTTSDPDYYKWTQWLFIKMWKKGLAYKKKAEVNFCPSCKTVLADEQVIDGACERCQSVVDKKDLEQWFFKITDYADRLLAGLDNIDWSRKVKIAQRNWIGKSEGRIIKFGDIKVFTTRPDTINAVTFVAISGQKDQFTGKYVINPATNKKIPVWEAIYVLKDYGTGAIMGVPAYDDRDREFATKYHIDILELEPKENDIGKKHTNYHLRDWLVSRQRYWGAPIPMLNCKDCGWVSVPEEDLPILLPSISDYKPEGTGKGPLANHPDFFKVKCPNCGGEAERETDVMDTFVDSSWYFLRYPSVGIDNCAFDSKITKVWLPVNLYFGGAEHSVLHLMYARFVTMVLHDLKLIDFDEPFSKFFAHGLMIKDGAKMSKSRGNVINPDEYVEKYGADTLRLYLMFMGPMDGSPDFRDTGIEGMYRFIEKLWRIFTNSRHGSSLSTADAAPVDTGAITKVDSLMFSNSIDQNFVDIKMHQTIKKVTEEIQEFKYNTAISAIMELVNIFTKYPSQISVSNLKSLALLLAPFTPYLAEELWHETLGNTDSVHAQTWPKYDDSKITSDTVTIVIQINGKCRSQFTVHSSQSTNKEEIEKLAKEDEKIIKWLDGKKIKKVIFVPGKIINFVIQK